MQSISKTGVRKNGDIYMHGADKLRGGLHEAAIGCQVLDSDQGAGLTLRSPCKIAAPGKMPPENIALDYVDCKPITSEKPQK